MLIPFKENLCSKYAEKMLSIKICNHCNMSCSFCVDRGGRDGEVINVEKIAQEAISRDEYKTVIITGGEPFLVFDSVVALCKELRPYKTRIVLNTNGSLLTAEKVSALNGLIDELQVSIHHYDEDRSGAVFGKVISFESMKSALSGKEFMLSINSTFNNEYTKEERSWAVKKMTDLCTWIGADRLRLTELKKVEGDDFVLSGDFFPKSDEFVNRDSEKLITNGCTRYYTDEGVLVSVKRLCEYAKGKDAPAFSCCFINTNGQKKIDVETKDTFKVIYSDGLVVDDWIFSGIYHCLDRTREAASA
jgi:MoaA/NifB/PqqE/SkfB family radical SAM enzyme